MKIPESFSLNDLYLNLLETLFKGEKIELDEATMMDNVKTYMQGVFQGFGGDFSSFEYDTPDYNKLAHLEANVYAFSGAKNWQMLRDLTDAVKDTTSFKEFKNKALTILDEYQGNWLKTEYNAAIAGSQMASKWVDFQKGAALRSPDDVPLLEYRTMEDGRVREEHEILDNTTKPVSDPWWDTYYPPNGWNCRCTVIRLNEGKETPKSKTEYPDIPKMFQVNLAEEGLVFPKGSAYFIGQPKDIKEKITAMVPDRSKKP
jgi:SPP1 gp7 family putative phage head morphogenesis protein